MCLCLALADYSVIFFFINEPTIIIGEHWACSPSNVKCSGVFAENTKFSHGFYQAAYCLVFGMSCYFSFFFFFSYQFLVQVQKMLKYETIGLHAIWQLLSFPVNFRSFQSKRKYDKYEWNILKSDHYDNHHPINVKLNRSTVGTWNALQYTIRSNK